MSIASKFPSHAEAMKAGWFSRRHETDAAHRSAQESWRLKQDLKADRELASREATAAYRAAQKARPSSTI